MLGRLWHFLVFHPFSPYGPRWNHMRGWVFGMTTPGQQELLHERQRRPNRRWVICDWSFLNKFLHTLGIFRPEGTTDHFDSSCIETISGSHDLSGPIRINLTLIALTAGDGSDIILWATSQDDPRCWDVEWGQWGQWGLKDRYVAICRPMSEKQTYPDGKTYPKPSLVLASSWWY